MRLTFGFVSLFIFALLASCTTAPQTTMLGPARAGIRNPAGVRVYGEPPKHFEQIAIVEGHSMEELRTKAAAVGANGLIASGVVRKNGPVIGVGIGTSNYHFTRNSAYGFNTESTFDVPTGANVLQGTAIYVP
ncbi:MAG: hypothetical protein M3128_01410 [Verrucomicrobiota bacterium]|nr:hypothetical protein [Verrucomicrobiota bacterium]